jgi:beta-glucosidase/6-phospho-beta-glucosidase/beta-galactosidase
MVMDLNEFYWAVGIENTFVPQTRDGLRALEQYELTQHYDLWKEDLDCAAELGISHIRWGIPWYKVNPAPGTFDWRWIDEVLDYMIFQKGIQPIIDLVHYGTPLWMENTFLNSSYPQRVAEYAYAVASRYRDVVQLYTPLNEPGVNAAYCGRLGQWPPYLEGEDGYTKVLMPLVKGLVLTAQAVREADPDAVLVQVEALGHMWSDRPEMQEAVEQHRWQLVLPFDLATGRVDTGHYLWPYLRQHGVREAELVWLQERAADIDILGVNVYPWSGGEMVMNRKGLPRRRGELTGYHLADILCDLWERYRMPMMVTETSAKREVPGRAQWMDETIAAVCQMRGDNVPVIGYTWFPAFTMVDWKYRMSSRPLEHYLLHLGLWDAAFDEAGILRRRSTPLVERYRSYVAAGEPQDCLPIDAPLHAGADNRAR